MPEAAVLRLLEAWDGNLLVLLEEGFGGVYVHVVPLAAVIRNFVVVVTFLDFVNQQIPWLCTSAGGRRI